MTASARPVIKSTIPVNARAPDLVAKPLLRFNGGPDAEGNDCVDHCGSCNKGTGDEVEPRVIEVRFLLNYRTVEEL